MRLRAVIGRAGFTIVKWRNLIGLENSVYILFFERKKISFFLRELIQQQFLLRKYLFVREYFIEIHHVWTWKRRKSKDQV